MLKFNNIESHPVYSKTNGKLCGWKMSWNIVIDYYEDSAQRFFKETWFRNSYRAMCRFQRKLLSVSQHENNK